MRTKLGEEIKITGGDENIFEKAFRLKYSLIDGSVNLTHYILGGMAISLERLKLW